MPKFRIYGIMTASKVLGEIDAGSKEEALLKADADDEIGGNGFAALCHQCAGEIDLGDIYEYQAEEVED